MEGIGDGEAVDGQRPQYGSGDVVVKCRVVRAGGGAAYSVSAAEDAYVAERDVVDPVVDVAETSGAGAVEYRVVVLEGAVVGADRQRRAVVRVEESLVEAIRHRRSANETRGRVVHYDTDIAGAVADAVGDLSRADMSVLADVVVLGRATLRECHQRIVPAVADVDAVDGHIRCRNRAPDGDTSGATRQMSLLHEHISDVCGAAGVDVDVECFVRLRVVHGRHVDGADILNGHVFDVGRGRGAPRAVESNHRETPRGGMVALGIDGEALHREVAEGETGRRRVPNEEARRNGGQLDRRVREICLTGREGHSTASGAQRVDRRLNGGRVVRDPVAPCAESVHADARKGGRRRGRRGSGGERGGGRRRGSGG